MNYNLSLDDIIKRSQNSNYRKPNKNFKNSKSPLRRIRSISSFKSKVKKKFTNVPDARIKITQNKKRVFNRSRNNLSIFKNVADARFKIEASKQKLKKTKLNRNNSAITRITPHGILERSINSSRNNDSGIKVEYEDDNGLECEGLNIKNLNKSFIIRRTVSNTNEKKTPLFEEDCEVFDYGKMDIDSPRRSYEPVDEFEEITRNVKSDLNAILRKERGRSPPFKRNEDRSSRINFSNSSRDSNCHRITISNLHVNVTGEDIKELFEDVGDLIYAKMIKDGVAEVAYRTQKDAVKAVEVYHNRLLDGLPMKCTISQNNGNNSSLKKRSSGQIPPVNTFVSVEPDTRIIRKALFSS